MSYLCSHEVWTIKTEANECCCIIVEPWGFFIQDGLFDGPVSEPPFGYVNDIAGRLLEIMEDWNQAEFDKTLRSVPEISEKIERYIEEDK